jgi:hypothetical protein
MDLKFMIPQTFLSLNLIIYGIIVHFNKNNDSISEIYYRFKFELIIANISGFIIFGLFNYLLSFFKYEVI